MAVTASGYYSITRISIPTGGSTLTIGLISNTTAANWLCADDFTLTQLSTDPSYALTVKLAELKVLHDSIYIKYKAISSSQVSNERTSNVAGKYGYAAYTALGNTLSKADSLVTNSTGTLAEIKNAYYGITTAYTNLSIYYPYNSLADGDYVKEVTGASSIFLSNGVYVVKVFSSTGTQVQKVVVK